MAEQFHKILIITAPSGAGKTSITHHLLQKFPQLAFSISAATRRPRSYEKSGVDYYFMNEEDFKEKIKAKDFAEWEMVYEGKYYGTLKSELERIWHNGQVPILDIDVKGALHVQSQYPVNTFSIFIEPPSIEELKKRLMNRGTETEDTLAARVNKASYEISFKGTFNAVIVNDNLNQAFKNAEEVVRKFLAQ